MNQNQQKIQNYRQDILQVINSVSEVMFGVERITELILISIICDGHILLEDAPGTGKTMLTNTIARTLNLKFRRVQGTPDLLPGDLTGVNVFNQSENKFQFVPGPIFTNFLLFDEINRASPKTQSALLEAMAESQVTIDNKTFELENPFFVIATQNPVEHIGTYSLPQAQLDRFIIKTTIGYPSREDEKKVMLSDDKVLRSTELKKLDIAILFKWQSEYQQTFVDESIVEKLLNIIQKTRDESLFDLGVSPRASQKLIKALKASAYIHGRDFVSKDDIESLFIPVLEHRVLASSRGEEEQLLKDLMNSESF